MSFEKYLKQLSDPTARASSAELFMLAGLDRASTQKLREAWPAVPTERRRKIVTQAGETAEDDVDVDFDGLFKLALNDPDASVRIVAIQGLWEYTRRDLVRPLLKLLKSDEESGVRSTAALALGRYVVLGEFEDLPAADKQTIEDALRETYEDDREELDVRARALESLGASSDPGVPDLIDDAHTSGNFRLRVSAIHAMGRNADQRWLPVLFEEMADDDAEVRFEAVGAAGMVAGETSITAIAELLEDQDSEVRLAAIEALGHIGGRRARQHLRFVLKDEDEAVRQAGEAALLEADLDVDPLSRMPGAAL